MVTINDVARVAGVSPATVSRVVNGKGKVGDACRARVQKIIQELGYKPNVSAQSLVNRHTTNVGLITPKISMEFFGNLAAGAEVSARDVGYSL
ncbi:MAG: LacI family transcriptional regulator, partial [Aestuariibacter sp.]|nr:LacI family transcriptional regulator [Aestuariibacter sp.]